MAVATAPTREQITSRVRKELRKRDALPARDLASRAGLTTKQIAKSIAFLVANGEAVAHKGPGKGDRSPRYTKA